MRIGAYKTIYHTVDDKENSYSMHMHMHMEPKSQAKGYALGIKIKKATRPVAIATTTSCQQTIG